MSSAILRTMTVLRTYSGWMWMQRPDQAACRNPMMPGKTWTGPWTRSCWNCSTAACATEPGGYWTTPVSWPRWASCAGPTLPACRCLGTASVRTPSPAHPAAAPWTLCGFCAASVWGEFPARTRSRNHRSSFLPVEMRKAWKILADGKCHLTEAMLKFDVKFWTGFSV